MSHYRNLGGGRRDKNEPEIMQRFRHHGWHPEQVSGNRQWDLNAYPPARFTKAHMKHMCWHVDVKGPKGKVEDAQREKWKALSERGIPVYVVRTGADVDALVRGELEPWRPEVMGLKATADRLFRAKPDRRVAKASRAPHVRVTSGGYDPASPPRGDVDLRTGLPGKVRAAYTPPRSTPVDAAKEAAATFAPPAEHLPFCEWSGCLERRVAGSECCPEHTP